MATKVVPPSKKPAGQADARVEPVQGPADQSGEQICLVPEKEESDSEYLGKGQAFLDLCKIYDPLAF